MTVSTPLIVCGPPDVGFGPGSVLPPAVLGPGLVAVECGAAGPEESELEQPPSTAVATRATATMHNVASTGRRMGIGPYCAALMEIAGRIAAGIAGVTVIVIVIDA